MNKKGFLKVLTACLVFSMAIGLLASTSMGQSMDTQVLTQNANVQIVRDNFGNIQTVLVDNFEYFNSPRNFEWVAQEPPYPMFGYGLGYGNLQTVLDFEEGSRVLDVYRDVSVFLFNTPYTTYRIAKTLRPAVPGAFSMLSFKVRAPFSVEQFDMFAFTVSLTTTAPARQVAIQLIPRENGVGANNVGISGVSLVANPAAPGVIQIAETMGMQFQDGTWHVVMEDLQQIINQALGVSTPIATIDAVQVTGNQYRLDDIMLTPPVLSTANNSAPYLFHIGPVYATLWDVGGSFGEVGFGINNPLAGINSGGARYIMVEDIDLGITMNDNGAMNHIYSGAVQYNITQIDADIAACRVPAFSPACALIVSNLIEPAVPMNCPPGAAPAPAPGIGIQAPPGCNSVQGNLPCFPGYAAGPPVVNPPIQLGETIDLRATVGDALGPQSQNLIRPIALADPTNAAAMTNLLSILPQEIPSMADGSRPLPNRTAQLLAAGQNPLVVQNPAYIVAIALWNSGYREWPGLGILVPAQGQVLEDLIVTVRATDGMATDMETFPVSIVNYPVNNSAPIINQLEDQFFRVGATPAELPLVMSPNLAGTSQTIRSLNTYRIVATDPDPQDQTLLTYKATLNGLPTYQIGPWFNQIINPETGVIAFRPDAEGALTCMVTVSDPRGMMAVGHFTIFCVNPGTMLNHAPAVLEIIESPQVAAAGQLFTISDLRIADPDGEPLYYSCNIGAVGRNGIYTYQCNFPGTYLVQVTAYDIRGGAVTQQFVLEVLPWWSY